MKVRRVGLKSFIYYIFVISKRKSSLLSFSWFWTSLLIQKRPKTNQKVEKIDLIPILHMTIAAVNYVSFGFSDAKIIAFTP